MARPVTKKPVVKATPKAVQLEPAIVQQVEPSTITQQEIEYNGHVIHVEPHGRVMVTRLGLHMTEFISRCEEDIDLLIHKAKEYIDNGSL